MDSTQVALLALLVGAVLGAGITAAVLMSLRVRDRHNALVNAVIPDGVTAMLAGMDDAAVVVDTSLRVVAASAAAAWFRLDVDSVLENEDLRTLVREARARDLPQSESLRIHRGGLSDELRLISARASVLGPRYALLIIRDMTEAERIEQMRQDFVSNTSHELKTPVGAISLLAEAIESAADDPEHVRKFSVRLTAETVRLSQLTNRIMNLSRLQASDELSEVRDVAIDEVVASAMEAHAVQADAAGIDLARGGTRGLYVRGDRQILVEAIGNLVANAIVYSASGDRVAIGVKLMDGVVEIAVTDQGIGIPESEQERIFERFYRADQARSRRTGGTGLGLSIVKHAVQRHEGEVRLWSRPGRGSTFTVRLPAIDPPAPEPPRTKKRRTKVQKGPAQ